MLCAKDIKFWVNNFVWTFDPRCKPSLIPMVLYPHQEDFLDFLQTLCDEEVDGLVEKSRDMGVTWLCCIFLVHRWLFTDGFKGGIGSRKEDLVDKSDDPDSIFEKARMLLKKLPKWMMPRGFSWDKHDKHLSLSNPENGSTITGEAGDNIGRGGRNTIYFIDEAAFIERPKKVDAALSQNTNVRVYVSTPNGNANSFASKRRAAVKNPKGPIRLFSMHWKQDPRKNYWLLRNPDGSVFAEGRGEGPSLASYPWYDKQVAIINDPVIVAQELDIDYTASIEGICIPAKWVAAAIDFEQWLYETKKLKLPKGFRYGGYDVAGEGRNKNVIIFRNGPLVTMADIQSWMFTDTTRSAIRMAQICNAKNIERLNYDSDGIGTSISGSIKSGNIGMRARVKGIRNGGKCSSRRWPTSTNKTIPSKDKFKNARAENWWMLRIRFEKTYEYKMLGVEHPLSELISIPDHEDLVRQLSSVLCEADTDDGKIKMESKKDMRERNVESPDYADALVFCFVEDVVKKEDDQESASMESYD